MGKSNSMKGFFLFFILISIILSFSYLNSGYHDKKYHVSLVNQVFQSKCSCRKEETISITYDLINTRYGVQLSLENKYEYYLTKEEIASVTCNLESALRRGKNTKIIGFSLYGKNRFYYNLLPGNILLYYTKL